MEIHSIRDVDYLNYVLRDGTRAMTADWNIGAFDLTAVDLTATGNILANEIKATGSGLIWSDGTTGTTPTSGVGTRLMWIPSKKAFRAGYVDGVQWDAANIGNYSAAFGYNSKASGLYSAAFGLNSIASGTNSAVFGSSTASGEYSAAFGYSTASGIGSASLGLGTKAGGDGSSAFGYNANVDATSFLAGDAAADYGAIAMGYASTGKTLKATGVASVAIGQDVLATADNSLSLGEDFTNATDSSFAVGFGGIDLLISANNANFQDCAIVTTGTLGAGAITGTSFIIGANTLTTTEWAFLDGQDQAVKTTSDATFASVNLTENTALIKSDATVILADDGTANLFLGSDAFNDFSASYNIGIGYQAGYNNDDSGGGNTGLYNLYVGYQAGYGATAATQNTGYRNVAMGSQSLYKNTTGNYNVGLGFKTLYNNTTGTTSMAIGSEALYTQTGGLRNIGIGVQAGFYNNVGDDNISIGTAAGKGTSASENNKNTMIGSYAGTVISTGSSNVFLGYQSGSKQTTNSNLFIIDNQTRADIATEASNSIIYGVMAAAPADQDFTVNANLFLTQIKSGATQVAAGAAANEVWKTASHATLPDNVLMIGV